MPPGNTSLNPEVLTGLEVGALLTAPRVSTRVTGFWNNLTDAITNITLNTTPALITKQKQNSDTVRARGLEVEADYRPYRRLTMSGSIVLTSSRYRHELKLLVLEGDQVPQHPLRPGRPGRDLLGAAGGHPGRAGARRGATVWPHHQHFLDQRRDRQSWAGRLSAPRPAS